MRIVITTAIYPPEVGGPSFYAQQLKQAFEASGHEVRVVLYGSLKQFPTGLRHMLYALKVLVASFQADAIIVLDSFSTAVPLALVSPAIRVPIICRVGGDFVWEQYVERTHDPLPLPHFYAHQDRWNRKERIAFQLIQFALRRMRVAFSSAWQRDIWMAQYSLSSDRVHVIENAVPPRMKSLPPNRKNLMFYGRHLLLKNADAFHRAFAKAQEQDPLLELEEGMMSRSELLERMCGGYAVAVPSISDVTPNIILESIACGKPFLITAYSAYAERFKDCGVIVDPLSKDDMARGILELAQPAVYERLSRNIAAYTEVRTYETIAYEFIALIKSP